jgi:hypothetical protein
VSLRVVKIQLLQLQWPGWPSTVHQFREAGQPAKVRRGPEAYFRRQAMRPPLVRRCSHLEVGWRYLARFPNLVWPRHSMNWMKSVG